MKPGYYISRNRCLLVCCVWVGITIMVGLMAGLIKKPCPEHDSNQAEEITTLEPTTSTLTAEMITTLPPQGDGPWMDPFLPSYTLPVHYDMWFYPDFYFNGSTFQGRENITINVLENTKYLLVHYKLMNITQTAVFTDTGDEIQVVQTFAYDPHEFWVTEVAQEIAAGSTVILHLEFEGSLVNGIVGYYKSTYVNSDTGEESWMATTKFQPTDARKAFPNFDEPKYKANFTISLYHWQNFTAISNMPNNSFVDIDDVWRETHFDTSLRMSSYLVCFIVTDFVYKEQTLPNGKPHRIWTSSDKIDQVDYALDVGTQLVNYFEQEFDMQYHLPKLDQVAVPDYPSGATEHWGLITYREARLLYDENQSGAADKQAVAEIVSHELAHNYFGNVITCEWWNDLWVNEGFATFYEAIALQDIEPEFEMEDHFVITTTQGIMSSDAELGSRAITANVTHPDEINQAFTGVVYSKAASLLRMIENFLGREKFRNALRKLLREHAFGSVVTDDVWAALQEEAGDAYDISTMMEPWFSQMGLPVVNVSSQSDDLLIIADQQRFLNDPSVDPSFPPSDFEYNWYIPLTYETPSTSVTTTWLNMTGGVFTDPRAAGEWIKLNHKQFGFYRVNYDKQRWLDLAEQLDTDHEVFTAVDRSSILDDSFNLARATQLDYPTTLNLTKYLEKESHYFPWSSASQGIYYISLMLAEDGEYTLWRKYMQQIVTPILNELKIEDGGSHLDKLNRRNNIIHMACVHGQSECQENTTDLFLKWVSDESFPLSPNLRRVVYKYGMQEVGDEDTWHIVWNRYTQASGTERDNLAYCLAWTDNMWLIQRYLDFAMDPTAIRTQDFFTVINYISANQLANRYLWDWTQANYGILTERFGTSDRYFGRMVPSIVSGYNTLFKLNQVLDFYNEWPDAGAGFGPRIGSLASIQSNIQWMTANRDPIINWLKDNVRDV